ncbi:MAG: tRNA pseudouridine(38-40) synthase TruA, partial [Atopostipes suicloacalis]|nr:tRNA pseudouridine(38-40) synthase TruA [Atopostipes suicloacalis]
MENLIRYKATIAYDGTDFSGFQIQPDERTVQGEIEKVLRKINKEKFVRIHPAGRTDAGAHAAGMVFHFDYTNKIPKEGLFMAINTLVSRDISLLELEKVSDNFHARYHAKAKTYIYRIHNQAIRNPFNRRFVYHHPYTMEAKRMNEALKVLIGRHDFTSFCSTKTDKDNKIRTIYDIK